jgi:type IV secretory pathway TrbD component
VRSPDRWSLGLLAAALLCCAAPVLIGSGVAAAAFGVVRQHWGWVVAGLGLAAFVLAVRLRRTGAA